MSVRRESEGSKCLTVVFFTHYEGSLMGGERLLVDLVNSLEGDYRIIIFTRRNGERFAEHFDREVVIHDVDYPCYPYTIIDLQSDKVGRLKYIRFMRWFCGQHLRCFPRVRRLLALESVDLVHSLSTVVAMGSLYSFLTRRPHVWHASETLMNRGFPQRIWVAYMNLTADSIIGVSKRTALDYGARTTVIENGVQIDEVLSRFEASDLERVRLEFDVGDQDFVLSCIGTLQASKGHHVLVGALAILARRFPERRFRVFLVGPKLTDPDFAGYTALLEGQISRLRLSGSIHLTGFRSDYLSFVKLADICVHPVTMADSYPAAVRDPMLCGRPVVATACGGIPEMIENGRTGLLVPANDTEALAEAISRIIDSPGFGRELVLNAREFAEEAFDARRMARQTEALYADVLDR